MQQETIYPDILNFNRDFSSQSQEASDFLLKKKNKELEKKGITIRVFFFPLDLYNPYITSSDNPYFRIEGIKEITVFIKTLLEQTEENNKNLLPKYTFEPNEYISSAKDIWLLESLFGKKDFKVFMIRNQGYISTKAIEQLFEKSKTTFYVDSAHKILSSAKSEFLESQIGNLSEIPILEALKEFGLKKLEEAKEKSYAKKL